nr:uncharacterized protein LOC109191692 [Ipomoea batatas]
MLAQLRSYQAVIALEKLHPRIWPRFLAKMHLAIHNFAVTKSTKTTFYEGSIASFDYFEKKHKARDGAELPVVKPEVEQRKVSRSNSAPSSSERVQMYIMMRVEIKNIFVTRYDKAISDEYE